MHGCRPLLKPITTGSLRRLVLLIMLILMCTILKRNWVISSAYRRSAFCLKISLSSTKAVRFRYAVRACGYRLRHSVVTVCENFDGEINVLYDGKALGWEKYVDGPEPIPLDDEKSVHERVDNARIDLRSKYYVKPKADHPRLTRRTQSHQQVKPPKLPKKKPDPDKRLKPRSIRLSAYPFIG